MSDKSGIEWTDATWNPTVGCTKVSPGCDHCYAETFVNRFAGHNASFPNPFGVMTLRDGSHLEKPLRWRRPRRIFVNSLSDLFHDDVPDVFIARVFAVMARTPRHTYQLLTKRHARMRSLLSGVWLEEQVRALVEPEVYPTWPLPNVWLGVSAEDQHWADVRVPALLKTPAAVRWVSAEPLLGPVGLDLGPRRLDWVVAGGESGPGARPMHRAWARSLRDQCAEAGVPFLFKQWGSHDEHRRPMSKRAAGRLLDGRTWDQYPETSVVQVGPRLGIDRP